MAVLPDPEDMTDEQLQQLLNGEEVTLEAPKDPKDPPDDTPPADPKPDDEDPDKGEEGQPAPKDDDDPTSPTGEEATPPAPKEDDPKPPSRREQLRVQQLLEKMQQGNQPPATPPKAPSGLDYKEELEADDETLKKLADDREAYGKQLYQQGRQEADNLMFHTRLEIDAPRVEAKYPFLDKTSDKFNERRADAVNTRYLQFVGFDAKTGTVRNPGIRYADYVEAEMEFARELAADEIATSTQNITRQTVQTGLRPGANNAPKLDLNKAPEDMTDEELKAKLASVIPTR